MRDEGNAKTEVPKIFRQKWRRPFRYLHLRVLVSEIERACGGTAIAAGGAKSRLKQRLAEPGIVGLLVIVLATAFNGVTEEHRIGHAFEEALPFTALLVVFFAIVAVIDNQGLFSPVIHWVMEHDGKTQAALFYIANGLLSMISDNVFVATVYITEIAEIYDAGELTREQFDALAVAINTGTNIPSVATPNGQAAFLFLLTSALAPLIRLSYGRMVIMAFPYTITMSITGLAALWYLG